MGALVLFETCVDAVDQLWTELNLLHKNGRIQGREEDTTDLKKHAGVNHDEQL